MNRQLRAALFSLSVLIVGAAGAVGLHHGSTQPRPEAALDRLRSLLPLQPACARPEAAHGLSDLIWVDKMPKNQDDPFEAYIFAEGGKGARLIHAKGRTIIDDFDWSADRASVTLVLRWNGEKI